MVQLVPQILFSFLPFDFWFTVSNVEPLGDPRITSILFRVGLHSAEKGTVLQLGYS